MKSHYDVVIVGGGPVGASLALALGESSLSVLLLEARTRAAADPRALALSEGTMLILERIGVRPEDLHATPIEAIHVSQKGSFGRAVLRAAECGVPALGQVVEYARLQAVLDTLVQDAPCEAVFGARVEVVHALTGYAAVDFAQAGAKHQITARLLVLADGGRSLEALEGVRVHERDYRQSALVAQVRSESPHRNCAFERFTPSGPVALLPYGEDLALVWTTAPDEAQRLCKLDDAGFLHELHEHFGDRLGRFVSTGPRAAFPLKLRFARPVSTRRLVLIGNAAQALHPVAGQGFNLGMRDAWTLAQAILGSPREALGEEAMLAAYSNARRRDAAAGIRFTDFLARGFAGGDPLLQLGRGCALAVLDLLPPARRLFARKMMFGVSG